MTETDEDGQYLYDLSLPPLPMRERTEVRVDTHNSAIVRKNIKGGLTLATHQKSLTRHQYPRSKLQCLEFTEPSSKRFIIMVLGIAWAIIESCELGKILGGRISLTHYMAGSTEAKLSSVGE